MNKTTLQYALMQLRIRTSISLYTLHNNIGFPRYIVKRFRQHAFMTTSKYANNIHIQNVNNINDDSADCHDTTNLY